MSAARRAILPYAPYLTRSVSEVADELERFAALLAKWQRVQNLVSRETLDDLWTRHIADSLQLLRHIPSGALRIVDIGSGGGFPALPVAIASVGTSRELVLIESNQRKASFLRAAIRELGLRARVVAGRAERIDPDEVGIADVVTARAVAPLAVLLQLAAPVFGPGTLGIFHKGREHVEEIREVSAAWSFNVIRHPSDTDSGGALVEISDLRGISKR